MQRRDGRSDPHDALGEVTIAGLTTAFGTTSTNTTTVGLLAYVPSDPSTAADWQALTDKMNELIVAPRW